MECLLEILGKPFGKERPRAGKYGFYTPSKTRAYEAMLKAEWRKQNLNPFDGYLNIYVDAYFPLADSDPKWKRAAKLAGIINPHRLDVDNILKIVLDGLQGVAFPNDDKVVLATVRKQYGERAGMRISIISTEPIEERISNYRRAFNDTAGN